MIRLLILSVAAVLGLILVGVGASPGAQAVLIGSVTINQPTYDTDQPRSWKLTFTGGFSNAAGWTVNEFQVVLIPKAGGISRTFATANPAGQNAWSITTDVAIEDGIFNAFVIARTWDATIPNPPKTLICSKVIEVNTGFINLATGQLNPTTGALTYASLSFDNGSPDRIGNVLRGKATTAVGTFVPGQNESAGTDYAVPPVLVCLPTDGGQFYRTEGSWAAPAGPNTTITRATDAVLYKMYIFSSSKKPTNPTPQLIATAMSPAR